MAYKLSCAPINIYCGRDENNRFSSGFWGEAFYT